MFYISYTSIGNFFIFTWYCHVVQVRNKKIDGQKAFH